MAAHVPQRPGVVRLSGERARPRWPSWLPALGWSLLLALLPWWLDVPLLAWCALARLWPRLALRLPAAVLRRMLHWGVPGLLLAVLRVAGTAPVGWLVMLLVALVAFSLVVLLENWLDRARSRAAAQQAPATEWPELALAPSGPPAAIIELAPATWLPLSAVPRDDPLGGTLAWNAGAVSLPGGGIVTGVEPRCAYSTDGRWLVLVLAAQHGLLLVDRRHGRRHRLRGWQLAGWHAAHPWLMRDDDHVPLDITHVLGRDADD